MKLIENLTAASGDSENAHRELDKAVLAGHIARRVTTLDGGNEDEEAVVCAMMHGLGRMLVAFYLPEHWSALQQRQSQPGCDRNAAAREALGMGLDEIGEAIAAQWSLPRGLTATLRDVPPDSAAPAADRAGFLAALSTMSSDCADVIVTHGPDAAPLGAMASRYASMLGVASTSLQAAIESASALLETASAPAQGGPAKAAGLSPADILAAGLAEMRGSAPHGGASQLIAMALETMHQAFASANTIAFLRNPTHRHFAAKAVIGPDAQRRLAGLAFPEQFHPDAFHAALSSDKIVLVDNAAQAASADMLPAWWRNALPDVRSVVIVPLLANGDANRRGRQPIGLICSDCGAPDGSRLPDGASIELLDQMRRLITDTLPSTPSRQ